MKKGIIVFLFLFNVLTLPSQSFLIEAESFDTKGGWVVDPQFVEQMGSPYLLAHGLGEPVENAEMEVKFPTQGKYHVWVRTKNWVPGEWEPPGRFQVRVGEKVLDQEFGVTPGWSWEYGGEIEISERETEIELVDLTGFDGRCDAIYFSTEEKVPPARGEDLAQWRFEVTNQKNVPEKVEHFDYVVVGGGIAGCASAIAAAEQGLKVALIHDRPVLGGNASSEIRVHTLGIYGHFERILRMLDTKHYPNGSPEAYAEDRKRHKNVEKYENIHLYLNWRAYDANTDDDVIESVDARHTSTGERIRFEAPLFADCTGDGWIGFWAGAEFMYGRESVDKFDEGWEEFGELWSPEEPDGVVMGSSVLWRTYKDDKSYKFPEVPWTKDVVGDFAADKGTWHWEYSRADMHQVHDAEEIRDHMLRAIYGSFANEKKKPGNEQLRFEWVSYLVGKRESRRLIGDHVFTFNDARDQTQFPDSVVVEIREVDVHYQQNLKDASKPDFLSKAMFYKTGKYYIPYRSLYSRDIKNMFMAGRCFSASHVGLGGPRVMRTTGQMGAAVGLAASICKKYGITPREVYKEHLDEYMNLVLSQNEKVN
ncbi:FAD-dependent oxidoreductase [Membranihabitans maritimus]|uniref:FAD-dependent oxidoreductase n=1 Tax=Membranihabitans maritimus TaxID=2904244 RepID=UPI001F4171F2|nr:FAD-dependent oxidoreductase [Membranihabitans maritimus]